MRTDGDILCTANLFSMNIRKKPPIVLLGLGIGPSEDGIYNMSMIFVWVFLEI